jgi:Flp pilus assembly pilin Flp
MVFAMRSGASRVVRGRRDERGQALVEFALILPLFLMIVVGIIQFGVALNYWLDLQRIANQGARWGAVNCGQSASMPGSDPCLADDGSPSLEQRLREDIISRGNDPKEVVVCYLAGDGTASTGDSIRVRLTTEFVFLGITGFLDDSSGLTMDLHADATMRLEQDPSSPALPPDTTLCST